MKLLVLFYSTYGHVYRLAQAVAEGAQEIPGRGYPQARAENTVCGNLAAMGATEAQKAFASVPVATADDLATADAIVFGTPTRFGNMAGQMRQFLDTTGGLWAQGKLVGKVGSVFASSATQHGGQESTILSFPYHTTTIAGGKGERK